ncbi:T4 beta protein [Luteibacter rhizovicinus]|uniref:T4 beta protein n=1 Tax=Luteibacter rhizovicinus TaxID=242606 RepID=A0A4V6P463_9GAMM|nr:beta family protein [Luteibacter rhizovicinus]TCV95979.1 T4 beta protein [Luteibacter rhizovicinus]
MTDYLPILRSRVAEIRGLRELPGADLKKLFPVIELTRSRRTPKNAGGDVAKSVELVSEVLDGAPFVADLTSLESLQNSEFDRLLDDTAGFKAWTDFAHANLPTNCVPMVHLLEPFELQPFLTQVGRLREKFHRVAVRIPTSYRDFDAFTAALTGLVGFRDVVVILDAGFITRATINGAAARLVEMLNSVGNLGLRHLSVASSSFPNSVVSAGGGDDTGEFRLLEVDLGNWCRTHFPGVSYGDYAAIHPMDFKGTVTNWVPRVDVMLDESFYYYRYRRSDGGYIRAAKDARADGRYVTLKCWAHDNIDAAAAGNPPGRSPSFWIANRVNFHLARQISRLGL